MLHVLRRSGLTCSKIVEIERGFLCVVCAGFYPNEGTLVHERYTCPYIRYTCPYKVHFSIKDTLVHGMHVCPSSHRGGIRSGCQV